MINKLSPLKNYISNKPSAQLALIAGVSGLIYALVFTFRFPLANLYHTIPPVDYTKLTGYSPGGLTAYIIGLGVLFWLYLEAIQLTAPTRKPGAQPQATLSARFIFFSCATLAAISIFSYPLTAIDFFVYAIRTRGWAVYDLNPLASTPETFPGTDPWPGLAGEWIDAPSAYGPLWETLSLGAFQLSGGEFLAQLFALKILAALAYLGCVGLVYKILQQLQPQWATTGAIAFGWSPLVLLESVQNGHNDIVMIFFLLAALWVFAQWRGSPQSPKFIDPLLLLACLFLALSILVKFVTVIIVPFLLISIAMTQSKWWPRLVTIALYGTLIGGVVIIAMFPFWPGLDNWAVLKTGSGAGRSLMALLILSFRGWLGTNTAIDVVRNLSLIVFALIYLYYLAKTIYNLHHNPKIAPTLLPAGPAHFYVSVAAAFFVLFWYVLLAAPVFHAWYLLWPFPLAILLMPYRRPLIAGTLFSITALLVIPYFETIRVWYPILLENHLLGHLIGVPLLIVPPTVAMLWPISPSDNSEV